MATSPTRTQQHSGLRELHSSTGCFVVISRFVFSNPTNYFVDNVAAGSEDSGFWFETYMRGDRESMYKDLIDPKSEPLGSFRGNVAHSNGGGTVC